MKKEELLAIGLSEEQADQVFAINGKEVTRLKNRLQTKEEQLAQAQTQGAEAAGRLQELEALDAAGLQHQVQEWQEKYRRDLDKQQVDHTVELALLKNKAKNVKLAKAALDLEALHMKEGRLVGLEEQLAALRESDGYLFGDAAGAPAIVAPAKGQKPAEVSAAAFQKMGYLERIGLKEKNPKLYEQLKGQA